MNFDLSVLKNDEKIVFSLRSLYSRYGYSQYKMSRFEEYDLYVKNKDFLVSDRIITFTDTNGKLMAMKPDVTLSIIKGSKDEPGKTLKLFYNENVYRANVSSDGFKEIMQTGLECIGDLSGNEISEVIELAALSLKEIKADCVLEISHIGILSSFLNLLGISEDNKVSFLKCIREKNTDQLLKICNDAKIPENYSNAMADLALLYLDPVNAIEVIERTLNNNGLLINEELLTSLQELKKILFSLPDEILNVVKVDFSVNSDLKYYNGIVFQGFIKDIPVSVLSGGQYDRLMKKLGRKSKAIGFAVYLDSLDRLDESGTFEPTKNIISSKQEKFLNIALPKGRLGEKVYSMFENAGFECPSILENGRKLIFENCERKVRYFWAKPSDVAVYVERGAADIGVAGKDILLEYNPDVYELLDLEIGKCRMCVASKKDFIDNADRKLRVATKFTNIARTFYASIDRDIDIVELNGSIEIAPILDLSDVIVDIVETGTTLKENDLQILETIYPISARLIANKSSFKFNSEVILDIRKQLQQMI